MSSCAGLVFAASVVIFIVSVAFLSTFPSHVDFYQGDVCQIVSCDFIDSRCMCESLVNFTLAVDGGVYPGSQIVGRVDFLNPCRYPYIACYYNVRDIANTLSLDIHRSESTPRLYLLAITGSIVSFCTTVLSTVVMLK